MDTLIQLLSDAHALFESRDFYFLYRTLLLLYFPFYVFKQTQFLSMIFLGYSVGKIKQY